VSGFDRANVGADVSGNYAIRDYQYQTYTKETKGGLGVGGIPEGMVRSQEVHILDPAVDRHAKLWGIDVVGRASSFKEPEGYRLQGGRTFLPSFGRKEAIDMTREKVELIAANTNDPQVREAAQYTMDLLRYISTFLKDVEDADGGTKQLMQG
jgi:hypothetical protein